MRLVRKKQFGYRLTLPKGGAIVQTVVISNMLNTLYSPVKCGVCDILKAGKRDSKEY